MAHKIEAIDYLRGLSILFIIIIHVLAWHDNAILTKYTTVPSLFFLRDILQFSVITLVICSGFSLYMSHSKLKFNEIIPFYKSRLGRLLLPWWIFLAIFFAVHAVLNAVFKIDLINISWDYVYKSFLMIGGIGFGWLILLMLMLTLLFPLLNYLYQNIKKSTLLTAFAVVYLLSVIIFQQNPFDIYALSSLSLQMSVSGIAVFVVGWCTVYLFGFYLSELYNKHKLFKKEIFITVAFVILFSLVYIIYYSHGLNLFFYMNKYPPTLLYLTFGVMVTFVLLAVFIGYRHFIHAHLKKFLAFFSENSFWLFMWNALTISIIFPLLSLFNFSSVYIMLIIDIILNIIAVVLLVKLQKLISLNIHKEKHHF